MGQGDLDPTGGLRATSLRSVLLELLDHAFEIRIAGPKASCEPVPAARGNPVAVRDHVELTGLTRDTDGVNVQALLDEGHETRDLDLVVLSGRTVNDFDLHSVLKFSCVATSNLF